MGEQKKIIKISFKTTILLSIFFILMILIVGFYIYKSSNNSLHMRKYPINNKLNFKYTYDNAHYISWDIDDNAYYKIIVYNITNDKKHESNISIGSSFFDRGLYIDSYIEYTRDLNLENTYKFFLQKGINTGNKLDSKGFYRRSINEEDFEILEESIIDNIKLKLLKKPEFIEFKNNVLYWKDVDNADTYEVNLQIAIHNDPVSFAQIDPIYIHKENKIDLSNYLKKYTTNCGISIWLTAIDSNGEYCNSASSGYTIKEIPPSIDIR